MNITVQNLLQKAFESFGKGEIAVAKILLNQAIQSDPSNYDALFGLGVIEGLQKNYGNALTFFNKAKTKNPQDQDLLFNIAKTYSELNNHQLAIKEYSYLVSINKANVSAWVNMGLSFYAISKMDDSIKCFLSALTISPNLFEGHLNLSMLFSKTNLYEKALFHGKIALSIQPNSYEAHVNVAISLQRLKRHQEAVHHFYKALEINNRPEEITGELVRCKMEMCDWSSYLPDKEKIRSAVNQSILICQPLTFISLFDDPKLEYQCANIYSKNKFPQLNNQSKKIKPLSSKSKIRVGYFSSDFYNHATSYLIAELIEKHDKNKFEIHGFSIGPTIKDEMYERISKAFTDFHETYHMSEDEILQLSKTLDLDIAIDLKGFTSGSRTSLFSKRIAPIQISYLGYPGSMAANYYDYIIADRYVLPEINSKYFSEKIIYLPNCYQPNDTKRAISIRKPSRSEYLLPEHSFVFCSFNNNYKITPEIFKVWMEILSLVKNSILWLYQDNPFVAENLRKLAKLNNIEPERLIFASKLPLDDHLARHHLADLFLDTFPCNAHTTASDALWAKLPVLTLRGNSFASRVASSLLLNHGLNELVADSVDEYKNTAIDLALNQNKLSSIKDKLSKALLSSPVFMTDDYAKNIENAFTIANIRYIQSLPPDNIYV